MNKLRRTVLRLAGGAGALSVAMAFGIFAVRHAWAANRNEAAFQAKAVADALKSLGAENLIESRDIAITAPDIAENGALVQIVVTSKIPNTQSIAIIAEKNPFPLAASYDVVPNSVNNVATRIKMGQTTDVRVIVKADGKFYTAVKEVKVTVGGCG